MSEPLLNNAQLAARLGISPATFYRHKKEFKHFEVTRPIGTRRYSAAKVEAFLSGRSTVQFGARTA